MLFVNVDFVLKNFDDPLPVIPFGVKLLTNHIMGSKMETKQLLYLNKIERIP